MQSKTRVEDGYSSDDMSFELAMLANGTGNGNKQNSKEYKLTPKVRFYTCISTVSVCIQIQV